MEKKKYFAINRLNNNPNLLPIRWGEDENQRGWIEVTSMSMLGVGGYETPVILRESLLIKNMEIFAAYIDTDPDPDPEDITTGDDDDE